MRYKIDLLNGQLIATALDERPDYATAAIVATAAVSMLTVIFLL